MWSPGIRRLPKILAAAPTNGLCLCLTHCQQGAGGIWGHVSTQNSVLPVPLLGEVPRDGPTGAPPSSFSFPGAAPCPAPPVIEGKGHMGAGQGLVRVTKEDPHGSQSCFRGRPSAPTLHFAPVSLAMHAPAFPCTRVSSTQRKTGWLRAPKSDMLQQQL